MARPVVAFGDGPVLDGLGANPAKCAVVDRGGVGIGTVCNIFRRVSLPQLAVILSCRDAVGVGDLGGILLPASSTSSATSSSVSSAAARVLSPSLSGSDSRHVSEMCVGIEERRTRDGR